MADTKNVWDELRKPFPKEAVGKMPRGGIQLDYIGHAAVTDRLNSVVGPDGWNWEPYAVTATGEPAYSVRGQQAVMWGKFTVNGVTKPCVGTAASNKMELEKELIGDLIRNGAMRFGVALELWSKDELESNVQSPVKAQPTVSAAHAPEEPSRQLTDEPVSNESKQKVWLHYKKKYPVSGTDDFALFCDFVINKGAPTTEQDAQKLLLSLAE